MKRLRSIPLRLAIRVLLAAAVIWNVVAAIFIADEFTRPVDICVAVVCTFVLAFTWGREQVLDAWRRSLEWMPREIDWHEDDDGVKHAFVTRVSGEFTTLAIPSEITSLPEALAFVYAALAEDKT